MFQAFLNIFRVAELRNKLLFTISMLVIYRLGFFIPLLGVDQASLRDFAQNSQGSALGDLVSFVGIFTGGSFHQSTIFGMGIMPYISAAIIFQLLGTVWGPLKELKEQGAAGQTKITEYTRYATVGLCIIQSVFWLKYMQSSTQPYLVYEAYRSGPNVVMFWLCGILGLTAGTVFLMWLGEQIDKFGIGNGVSLIITAGIVAGMPQAISYVYGNFSIAEGGDGKFGPDVIVFLLLSFVAVVAGSIIITQGQRRIPIQQAKHTRGRRVYGGQKSYLPLRVNHGGVMPIIFASALMMFPTILLGYMAQRWELGWLRFLSENFRMDGGYLYIIVYIGMIYFFAYFWTTVQFQPKEMAKQLRDHGSFIPGLRPGPRTADYLETVMERITYVGAGFLAIIAVIPTVVAWGFKLPMTVTAFLGGTGLLIVVSVMLDFLQRIEATLAMRNYKGFLDNGQTRQRRG